MSVFVIAEAGVNHNGDPELARKLVDLAARAGADAVKFQTFKAERLVTRQAEKAPYQKETTHSGQTQFEMLKKLELNEHDFVDIANYCRERSIEFLSTPFDPESLEFLIRETGMETIKIPSGEVVNGPLLLRAGMSGKNIIMSTGMCDIEEIRAALSVLAFGLTRSSLTPGPEAFDHAFSSAEGRRELREKVTLLHCTSEYPAPFAEVNLLALEALRNSFDLPVGLSDHSTGTAIPIAAVALSASVIEKHFTLDRDMEGPDHQASLSPDELRTLITEIKNTQVALGDGRKVPTFHEKENKAIIRQSIVAAKEIKAGERFSSENLTTKRPGTGVSPMYYWELIGSNASADYSRDQIIDINEFPSSGQCLDKGNNK